MSFWKRKLSHWVAQCLFKFPKDSSETRQSGSRAFTHSPLLHHPFNMTGTSSQRTLYLEFQSQMSHIWKAFLSSSYSYSARWFYITFCSNPLMNLLCFFQIVFLGEKVDKRRDIVSSGDCTFIKKTQKINLMSESYYLHFLWLPIPHSYCRRDHISPMAVTQGLARCPRWVNLPLELAFHISRILFIDARYPICGHLLIQMASWSEKVSVSDCFWVK